MLTDTDLQKIKEVLDPRFDRIEKKLKEHDERFLKHDKEFKLIRVYLKVEFESIQNKFQQIDEKFEDHRKRIMTLQDTVVGMDKYLHGELALILRDHDRRINILEENKVF